MLARMAYSYVRLLLALEVLLFALSLLLHITVLIVGVDGKYELYGRILGGVAIVVGICAFAFINDSLMWMGQIKTCPRWMWRTALALSLYAICIWLVQFLLLHDAPDGSMAIVISAFPIPLNAISCCVLYPVLRRRVLSDWQVVKRARNSTILFALIAATFLVYRAGYLPGRAVHPAEIPQ